VAGAPYYYKLCAVDIHGNVSPYSTLLPSGTVDVPGSRVPREVLLARPAPNPGRGGTTLHFGLPRPGAMELALYDSQGRRVRELLSGMQPAGTYGIRWDGCDEGGRPVASGLYFVRLSVEGRRLSARLAIVE
jgi:hypothetical protein